MVIHNRVPLTVELGCQGFLRQRHAHRIGQALPQRARGRLNARGIPILGVARRFAMQLPKLLDVLDTQVVTGQMQQGINQHGPVPIGQHKAVSIRPVRVGGVVAHHAVPENFGNVCHSHRSAGMAGVCGLNRIHSQRANGVGQFNLRGHQSSGVIQRGVLSGKRRLRSNQSSLTTVPVKATRICVSASRPPSCSPHC